MPAASPTAGAPAPAGPDPRWAGWPVDRMDAIQQGVIPAGMVGPPPGWSVVVFEGDRLPTGEYGLCYFHLRKVEVSRWAATPSGRRFGGELPALSHELAHAWVWELTGDSALASRAGH